MSSSVAAGLWVTFSVGLLVGLWAEAAEQRSPRGLSVSEWVLAALGLLRAELVVLLGLMVLLVLQPVSWVPFAALVVMAGGRRGDGAVVAGGCRGVPACDRAVRRAGWGCVLGDDRRLLGPRCGAVCGWRGGRCTGPTDPAR